jgi:DNA-binding MarR family transcriptional regulator
MFGAKVYNTSMGQKLKTGKQMERHFKGMANHHRIDILILLDEEPGVVAEAIAERLKVNFKTTSQHTRSLVQAGLLQKRHRGRQVMHSLSPYGELIVKFIKSFQRLNAAQADL